MAVREIVKYGHPSLHTPAAAVVRYDQELQNLVQDMVDTMYGASGVGLAAPQIGVSLRVIVIDLSLGEDAQQLIRLVNPEIVAMDGKQCHEEGCLSVPGHMGSPVRPAQLTVKGLDVDGHPRLYTATDLLARAFSHEIDHVEGRLFVDRLSPLKRDLLKRKLRRLARQSSRTEMTEKGR
jgi:peptide deformylase